MSKHIFMVNVIEIQFKTLFICFVVLIGFSSCNFSSSSTEDIELTPEEAIGKLADLSPTEGAHFFVDNRSQYSFLDTLYTDNIVPIIGQCSFDFTFALSDINYKKSISDSA